MLTITDSLRIFLNGRLSRFVEDESGQTIVEYVLMIVLVALAVVAAAPTVTDAIAGVFTRVVAALQSH